MLSGDERNALARVLSRQDKRVIAEWDAERLSFFAEGTRLEARIALKPAAELDVSFESVALRLCDDSGMVSHEFTDDGVGQPIDPETYLSRHNRLASMTRPDADEIVAPFPCTGSAHLAGSYIRCTSSAHN